MQKCPNPRCDSWGDCANPIHQKNRAPDFPDWTRRQEAEAKARKARPENEPPFPGEKRVPDPSDSPRPRRFGFED